MLGVVGLIGFVAVERRVTAPMLPLDLFRSRTFSGANLLTLCVYTSLSAVMFFLPLNLIQVQHYSATAAGAALLPFIVLMFVLSRWSGGILRRHRPRPVLIAGSLLTALGVALFAVPGIGGPYATTFLPPVVVVGLGMAVTVAPLTTTVMGAVDEGRAGIASGVNNAVSRVAGFLAIAVFGLLFTAVFERSLDRRLPAAGVRPEVRAEIDAQRSAFAAARVDDAAAERVLGEAFVDAFRVVSVGAALLAILGAASAAWLIEDTGPRRTVDPPRV
jgi:MFS family permease